MIENHKPGEDPQPDHGNDKHDNDNDNGHKPPVVPPPHKVHQPRTFGS
jgi:hypothetical protein